MAAPSRALYQSCLAVVLALPAAAASLCAPCHPKQVDGYARTGMGNSLGRPRRHPEGAFAHAASGSRFTITSTRSGMRHRIEQAGLAAEYEVDYFIGSGNMGRSYLVRVEDYLFQSPVSYYSRRRSWDVSPGYQQDLHPDFNRAVTAECLFCHAGRAAPVKGTLNRYQDPPFAAEAISCERCHGPVERHLAEPSTGNIANPGRLAPRARDSVCEQCHLGGEARIPNPGADFADFRPGRELEEVFSVYVFRGPAGSGNWKVVSHSEQLALSACAQASGSGMWCGSCHDPHQKPVDPRRYYRERCLSCHGAALLDRHPKPSEDCIGCHMPRRATSDVAHTAVTDHQIRRRPAERPFEPARPPLVPWRDPPALLARRNLGLACISVGERDQSADLLNEGFRLLAGAQASFPKDPALLTGLGLVLLRKNVPAEAVRVFEQAVRSDPTQASHHVNLAVAQRKAGDLTGAVESLDRAIELDRSLEDAYYILAEIYGETRQPERRRLVLERYLRFVPHSIQARLRR